MADILLADDDDALRNGLARLLESAGHRVSTAIDGAQALRLFRAAPPDLIITDINMPGTDGIEVIMAFRDSNVPVIAISGGGLFPKELLLANAAALGAVECIAKPFDPQEVLATADRLLRRAPHSSS